MSIERMTELAVQRAIERWEEKTGWIADYAVVQGFQIVVDRQYAELLAENERMRYFMSVRIDFDGERTVLEVYEDAYRNGEDEVQDS